MDAIDELTEVVARLRGDNGCPWDRAQTPSSLRPYVLEEAYEALDALDRGDDADLRKELGDLLFQIVLLARMAEERGAFTLRDVVAGVTRKMIDRHPHVFDPDYEGDGSNEGDVSRWEARKAEARGLGRSALEGVPLAIPALLRAHRISEKASQVGFDWPDAAGARAKVGEELGELDQAMAAGDAEATAEEFGDLLFAAVNLGRFLPVGAEEALREATGKFERRFRAVERRAAGQGRFLHQLDADALEALWVATKAEEGAR